MGVESVYCDAWNGWVLASFFLSFGTVMGRIFMCLYQNVGVRASYGTSLSSSCQKANKRKGREGMGNKAFISFGIPDDANESEARTEKQVTTLTD